MSTEKEITKRIQEGFEDGNSAWCFANDLIKGIDLLIKDAQGDRLTMLYAMKNAACFISGYTTKE